MAQLTFVQAQAIIAGAIARARETGIKPITVVVLDQAGQVVAAGREDGATGFRYDIAFGKAWAAASMGTNSRQLGVMATKVPHFFNSLSALSQGRFVPHIGGVLIKDADGAILGAVGASGAVGDEDEDAVTAGIVAAGLVAG